MALAFLPLLPSREKITASMICKPSQIERVALSHSAITNCTLSEEERRAEYKSHSDQLEHIIRAASRISDDCEIVVIGSQCVHAQEIENFLLIAYTSEEADGLDGAIPLGMEEVAQRLRELRMNLGHPKTTAASDRPASWTPAGLASLPTAWVRSASAPVVRRRNAEPSMARDRAPASPACRRSDTSSSASADISAMSSRRLMAI